MIRVILTILLVSTLLKIVAFGGAFDNAFKCEFVKFSEADEDGGNKKGAPAANKYDNDDKLHFHHAINSSGSYITGESFSSGVHQKPYLRFSDKPTTPPPNLV